MEVSFLFDNQLVAALESLIKNAKSKLLLVSPFIDLDARIMDALHGKISNPNFQLHVLFGKNDGNYKRSFKRNSFEFLRNFPNIEIRYSERLHAKFYQNDFEFIMTSMNLYDYSLANNIEVGIKGEYASKGLIARAVFDTADAFITEKAEKLKTDFLGFGKDENPLEKFANIFETAELKYKTKPVIKEKSFSDKLLMSPDKLERFEIIIDTLGELSKLSETPKPDATEQNPASSIISGAFKKVDSSKAISASALGKKINKSGLEVTNFMQLKGLVNGEQITAEGLRFGICKKNYMGKDYIAYPESLPFLDELK